MTAAPRNDSPDLMVSYSEKCAEHGYLVSMLKDTRDTMKAEVVEARAWREKTTGELWGIREAIAEHIAESKGRDDMKAEITGEILTGVRRGVVVAKWILGAVAALLAGGGVTEGLRQLLGGG
jgi:hypothetical protein